jgi:DNA-binding MarR family transcriptional regulator
MARDLADELRRAMQRLFRNFGALAAESTPCGKPLSMAHAHALMVLLAEGERSQLELGAELRIDKSNVARLCAKMADMGHVDQRPGDRDGRSRIVSLTPQGRRLAREVDAASHARFAALLAAMPEGRRSQTIEGLQQVLAALEVMRNQLVVRTME